MSLSRPTLFMKVQFGPRVLVVICCLPFVSNPTKHSRLFTHCILTDAMMDSLINALSVGSIR